MKTTIPGLLMALLCLGACRHEAPLEWSDTPYLNINSPWVESTLQRLSIEEKIGQLIFVEVEATNESVAQIVDWDRAVHPAGVQVYGLPLAGYRELFEELEAGESLSRFFGTREQLLLNNQFADAGTVPAGHILPYLSETDSLRQLSRRLLQRQMAGLHINMQSSPFELLASDGPEQLVQSHLRFVDALPLAAVGGRQDSVYWDIATWQQLRRLQNRGIAGYILPSNTLPDNELSPKQLAALFRTQLDFKGILMAEAGAGEALPLLAGTVDMLKVSGDPTPVVDRLKEAYREGILTDRELDIRVAKVLQAKEWLRRQQETPAAEPSGQPEPERVTYDRAAVIPSVLVGNSTDKDTVALLPESPTAHFDRSRWRLLNQELYEKASVLLHNRQQLLPFRDLYRHFFRLVHLGSDSRQEFERAFGHYADYSKYYHLPNADGSYPRLRVSPAPREICVVTLNEDLDAREDSLLLLDLRRLASDREVVLLHFGGHNGLAPFDTSLSIVHFPEMNDITQALAAQILFGGVSPKGKLPKDVNTYFRAGRGEAVPVTRLSYQIPEAFGIAPEKLVGIDAIAQSAIEDGAFPGCQILVAKEGAVIYSKAFGHHDYSRQRKVNMTDLYDVASITKVAATTLAAMKMYELGKLDISERVKDYLDCPPGSTIKNIPIKKLLIHQSGLQPHMPVIPYLLFRDTFNVGCDSFFCNQPSEAYPYQVADNFYFSRHYHDKIWEDIHQIPVRSQRQYRYSDVNFFLVQQMLQNVSGMSLDALVEQYFYTPLGLRYTTYSPWKKFPIDRLVPTQQDERWRQQLVHGFVHDETAALMGGVAGHAGLFANAEDLAVVFQMLLNEGYYGDRRYLQPETIELFTSADHGNHRGFGFDTAHPDSRSAFAESASERSFGHTGFTGTCIWADPDNDLLFVFLSNRINPSIRNKKLFRNRIRERIHEVVYDALETYEPQSAAREILMK